MARLNLTRSFLNADRLSSATRLSSRASLAKYESSARSTKTVRVLITESGPESIPGEDRIPSDWWICVDQPGPHEATLADRIPTFLQVTVNRRNFHQFEQYLNAPHKTNYAPAGAVLVRDSVPLGLVRLVEVKQDFRTGVIEHIYQVQTNGEVRSGT